MGLFDKFKNNSKLFGESSSKKNTNKDAFSNLEFEMVKVPPLGIEIRGLIDLAGVFYITKEQLNNNEEIIINTPQGNIAYRLNATMDLNKVYRFKNKGDTYPFDVNLCGDLYVKFEVKSEQNISKTDNDEKLVSQTDKSNKVKYNKVPAKSKIQSSMYRVIICDNATILRIQLKEMLEKCNYEVVAEATNGNEAVDRYFKYKPDLIFMDIAMPNMDGISALKKILVEHKLNKYHIFS